MKIFFQTIVIIQLLAIFESFGQAKEVIVKLKPEYFNSFNIQKTPHEPVKKVFKKLKVVSVSPLFLKAPNDHGKKDRHGHALVNLAAMMKVQYNSEFSVNDAIELLKTLPYFEYVSPGFSSVSAKALGSIPNDPYADTLNFKSHITGLDSAGGSWQLRNVNAYKAWQIHKGDTNTVVAIADWGFNYNHEELTGSLKRNFKDPVDGIDNDNNGYVDDFLGWDFGMGDNDPINTCLGHGTEVAGVSSASANNGKGFAGTGYDCKFMAIKINADGSGCPAPDVLTPIIYAANNGAKVLNLSLDVPGYYQIVQDLINYAVINKDMAVVASAGQSSSELDVFPASHDNVLSVAMSDFNDCMATDATRSHYVDLMAPGKLIWGINGGNNNSYGQLDGSSYSAPVVSGALALVRSKFPQLTAQQAMELVRVTARPVENIKTICGAFDAANFKEKLGKGVLDMYKALTDTVSPAVRYDSHRLVDAGNGQTALFITLRNFLRPTSNLKTSIRSLNSLVGISDSLATYGVLGTMQSIENGSDGFGITISSSAGQDFEALIRIGMTDVAKNYTDYQYVKIQIKQSFINLDVNRLQLSITSNGRLGYTDFSRNTGMGLYYLNSPFNPQLFESGLMIGLSSTVVSNCVINAAGTGNDNHFKPMVNANYKPVSFADQYIESVFSDSLASTKIGVQVTQRSYAYRSSPDDKFIIVEYTCKNLATNVIDSLSVGLFNQWSIGDVVEENIAAWDCETRTGYAYDANRNNAFLGVTLLSSTKPGYFAMNNSAGIIGNINPTDGFSSDEKWQSLTQSRLLAGSVAGNNTSNVSNVTSGKIYGLQPGQSQKIAFAYVAGDSLKQMKASAQRAISKYAALNAGPVPSLDTVFVCNSDVANHTIIKPTNGSKFNFYTTFPGCNVKPAFTGSAMILNSASLPISLYITNTDSSIESDVKQVIVKKSTIVANFTVTGSMIQGDTVHFFSDQLPVTGSSLWNFDPMATSTLPDPAFVFTSPGSFLVTLTATNVQNCKAIAVQSLSIVGAYLNLNVDSLVYDSLGGTQNFIINSNTRWAIQNPATWLTLSTLSGRGIATITGIVDEKNPWGFDRDTNLVIRGKELSVKQRGQKPYLILISKNIKSDTFNYYSDGQNFKIFIKSNIKWDFIIDSLYRISSTAFIDTLYGLGYDCGPYHSFITTSTGFIRASPYTGLGNDTIYGTITNSKNYELYYVKGKLMYINSNTIVNKLILFPSYNPDLPARIACAIESEKEKQILISPNPARSIVQIRSKTGFQNQTELFMIDNLGRRHALPSTFSSQVIEADISAFQPGMYLLSVQTGDEIYRDKLVIDR